jgi:hypothetical protein
VIALLEERLPASPYWRAEWALLGGGEDGRMHLRCRASNSGSPGVAVLYVVGVILAVTS